MSCRCENCDWPVYLGDGIGRVVIDCPQCKQAKIECSGETPPEQQKPLAYPIAIEDWPRWARLVKRLRKPEDAGVGDTVERWAAMVGGERFKRISERIGIPCGCTARKAEWNRLYPYS